MICLDDVVLTNTHKLATDVGCSVLGAVCTVVLGAVSYQYYMTCQDVIY